VHKSAFPMAGFRREKIHKSELVGTRPTPMFNACNSQPSTRHELHTKNQHLCYDIAPAPDASSLYIAVQRHMQNSDNDCSPTEMKSTSV